MDQQAYLTAEPQPQMLDLNQFSSLEDALKKVEPRHRYRDVVRQVMPRGEPIPGPVVNCRRFFFLSEIARSQGLHAAIAREIRGANPHAVFPLLRAFLEDVALVVYAADHPEYVEAVTDPLDELSKHGPKRIKPKALLAHAQTEAPRIHMVHRELSENGNFGSAAMWASPTASEQQNGSRLLLWSRTPRWRDEKQALIACAETLELADAMERYLLRFGKRYLCAPVARAADHGRPGPGR